jgi:hypothetical protein
MTPSLADGGFAFGVPVGAFDLPHPRIHPRIFLLVRRVLIEAFSLLRQREGSALAGYIEDEITRRLRDIIENDFRHRGVAVPGFDRENFECVARQSEVENYNCTKVQKKPDMVFRFREEQEPPRILSTHHALFVECKPVDATHPAGSDYCDEGLRRFVVGDYAWAMQDALMIGYVRAGRSIARHLVPALASRADLQTVRAPGLAWPDLAPAEPATEALHVTVHERGFSWCGGKGPACPVTIYHSWHQA